MLFVSFITDCGTDYHLENGHVNFTGRPTLINHTVPVLCDDGYYIQGDRYITCLSDGTWSQYTRCRSTSKYQNSKLVAVL